MLKIRNLFTLITLLLAGSNMLAQTTLKELRNINSPYSSYGIGISDRSGLSQNRALGGLAMGLRIPGTINFLNPASYNVQDTNSFIFDAGLNTLTNTNSTNSQSVTTSLYNINHLAINFFITPKWYGSIGLVPFSSVGYEFQNKETMALRPLEINNIESNVKGSGGLSQFYWGNSYAVINDKLNIGVNVSYNFGSIHKASIVTRTLNNTKSYTRPSVDEFTSYNDIRYNVADLMLTFGLQYTLKLKDNNQLIIGATYDLGTDLKTQYNNLGFTNKGDTLFESNQNGYIRLPSRYSIGATYSQSNKLILGADFIYQSWSQTRIINENPKLADTYKGIVGFQFTPDNRSFKNYFSRISYRAGAYYGTTPIKFDDTKYKNNQVSDYGFSLGVGIPYRSSKSMCNVSFEMGIRGDKNVNPIQESYKRVTISLTLQDYWFYKRKFD